jgi:hypothetical protein
MVSILNILFFTKLYTVLCEIVKSQRFAYDKKRRQKQRNIFIVLLCKLQEFITYNSKLLFIF